MLVNYVSYVRCVLFLRSCVHCVCYVLSRVRCVRCAGWKHRCKAGIRRSIKLANFIDRLTSAGRSLCSIDENRTWACIRWHVNAVACVVCVWSSCSLPGLVYVISGRILEIIVKVSWQYFNSDERFTEIMAYSIVQRGSPNTLEYRVYFGKDGHRFTSECGLTDWQTSDDWYRHNLF